MVIAGELNDRNEEIDWIKTPFDNVLDWEMSMKVHGHLQFELRAGDPEVMYYKFTRSEEKKARFFAIRLVE